MFNPAIVTTLMNIPRGFFDDRYHLQLAGSRRGDLLFQEGRFRVDCLGSYKGDVELYGMKEEHFKVEVSTRCFNDLFAVLYWCFGNLVIVVFVFDMETCDEGLNRLEYRP